MKNPVLLQFFHWYTPADGALWRQLAAQAHDLKEAGIDMVWLPPAYKGDAGANSVGYDPYDLYDLGEFDQKGSVRTKYGTKDEYVQALAQAHQAGLQIMADIVVNHKGGADETEKFPVYSVNPDNRLEHLSEPYEIEGFTKFTFPGRNNQYSNFQWRWHHFTGVDYASDKQESGIFIIEKAFEDGWQKVVGDEFGNYDYLMYADIDFRNEHVRSEIKNWGKWYVEMTGIDGFRLDAIKHIPPHFFNEWLDYLREATGKPLFTVGEFWHQDIEPLTQYLQITEGRLSLFDAPLHYRFYEAGKAGADFNLCSVFDGTLVQRIPLLAVTLVENHDSQPLQSLESPIEAWFKPLAYALILLREQGLPCVFQPDLSGAEYTDQDREGTAHTITIKPVAELPVLLQIRRSTAYGEQHDYFDHPNLIGWTRLGQDEQPDSGCAVVLSNHEAGSKVMHMGSRYANAVFADRLHPDADPVQLDENGTAAFAVPARSVAVWAKA